MRTDCHIQVHVCALFVLCQVTLIREYAQGPNALMYCLPTGALDPQRHKDMAECAARELSEEVRWVQCRHRECIQVYNEPVERGSVMCAVH